MRDCKRTRVQRFGERSASRMCISGDAIRSEPRFIDTSYDEIKSDDEYVVIDGKDVEALIKELQNSGEDALFALEDEPERFVRLAEARDDVRRKGQPAEGDSLDEDERVMNYFTEENIGHMPKWARDAFEKGKHTTLEKGSWDVLPENSKRRLHGLVEERRNGTDASNKDPDAEGRGIMDCTVADVAVDYGVPAELVVDILLEYGVKTPISTDDWIQERLSGKEMESLLHLITSFDAQDLADRYSDRSVAEIADYYDLDVDELEQLCEDEGVFLSLGSATRLQMSREDRVLDILLHDAPRKKPYPSLLEGLVAPV